MTNNRILTDDEQIALGKPTNIKQLNPEQVQLYLDFLYKLIESKKINLYSPSSILNNEIYESLSEEQQGKVDKAITVLAGYLRVLKKLIDTGGQETYQAELNTTVIWKYKEKYEKELGDIFII